MKYFSKNIPNWHVQEYTEELKIFKEIYKERPIKELLSYNSITFVKLI